MIPEISCIIPTFNRSSLLREAIESTQNQSFTNWELIIVDDGSQDDTENLVSEFIKRDSRIRYFKNDKKGPSSARNYGVSKSRGKYIVFLDDDDISLPHRFQRQLSALHKSTKQFVVSGYEVRKRSDNSKINQFVNELKGFGAGFPSRWIITKSLFEKVGGFDENLLTMEDPEFSYRVAQHEIFAYHADIVTIMYMTDGSISTEGRSLQGKVDMMKKIGSMMHPLEAAIWYFSIGIDYFNIRDKRNSLLNLRLAAMFDNRGIYYIGLIYAKLFYHFGGLIKNLNMKILRRICDYKIPVLVEHSVIH